MNLAFLIPLFPLVGFLINGLFRKSLSKSLIGLVGSGTILASFIVSLVLFLDVKNNGGGHVINYFDFISVGKLSIPFAFQIDQLSFIFLLIITGIGFLIHVYSTSYMHDEPSEHYGRFFAYLNLFVFSMLLLVMGANYVVMFIGWEGVGLCSYLLIGFWYKNNQYNYAARKAFVMNRIGDLGFLLAVFWLVSKLGTVNYNEVFLAVNKLSTSDITIITMLLFVGACGKSAQIPLYTWLPDAMAGPTPVSALIHAATMVTAGIYMVCRSNILYTMAPCTQTVMSIVGLATVLLAASIALKQNDIKKVLAYSTVSQLGYMVLALGVGAYTGAIFHVMTHAFFKACLFLGAGSVIHAVGGNQDMRTMGGLKKYMPITNITFLLSCFAIAGVPPFSGFFSKDEILAAAFNANPLYYWLGVAGALMTAFYMFRLYAGAFLGTFRGTHEEEHHLHESPKAITIPLIILAILAVVGGFVGIPEVFVKDANVLEHFLDPIFEKSRALQHGHTASHSTELMLMAVSTVLIIAMIIWAWSKYAKWKENYNENRGFAKILENAWYVDSLYNSVIVNPILGLSNFLKNIVEKGIDGIVNGVGSFLQYMSGRLRLLQNGQVESYLLVMVFSIVALFLIFWNQAYVLNFLHKIF
ncbi:MAG: NADH-quinone oxidoreductase subunit L [Pseudopedobacter saltans]|uniref:NADH-quinone oxidoreductase subunit L n=1 Tax=Pseudopedobacter saltans TaxID=151895 RepID=A0A2W5EPN1_9SPHI|nr:MAG: NADH-quinone oxidoreductase subunit L [Pseudopedobacter saltans]